MKDHTHGHNPRRRSRSAPRHLAPRHHRGRHRAPLILVVPRKSRYVVLVGAALAGAGAVALGSASALPPNPATPADPATIAEAPSGTVADGEAAARTGGHDRADRTVDRPVTPVTPQPAERHWRAPLDDFDLTSLFGLRWGVLHQGLDLGAPEGTPVYAAYPGTVVESGWNDGGYGQVVVIDHGGGVETLYAHNSSVAVTVGDVVAAGDHIANVGDTGNSFGPHSHFEVRRDGNAVDPLVFLASRGVDVEGLAGAVDTGEGLLH